jgi:hypothetical protein
MFSRRVLVSGLPLLLSAARVRMEPERDLRGVFNLVNTDVAKWLDLARASGIKLFELGACS